MNFIYKKLNAIGFTLTLFGGLGVISFYIVNSALRPGFTRDIPLEIIAYFLLLTLLIGIVIATVGLVRLIRNNLLKVYSLPLISIVFAMVSLFTIFIVFRYVDMPKVLCDLRGSDYRLEVSHAGYFCTNSTDSIIGMTNQ